MASLLEVELAPGELPCDAGAESFVYKVTPQAALKLHVLRPRTTSLFVPAVLFFFPGGWRHGKVVNFLPHAQAMVEEGWLAILADYRVRDRHGTEPRDSVEDALDCFVWLRENATRLGYDPHHLVVAGGSSGGHLAACVGLFESSNGKLVPRVKEAPAALVLFNPVLDVEAFVAARRDKLTVSDARAISPLAQVHAAFPATLIMHGSADQSVPAEKSEEFARKAKALGLEVAVLIYPGKEHGFYNPQKDTEGFALSLRDMKNFLGEKVSRLRPDA